MKHLYYSKYKGNLGVTRNGNKNVQSGVLGLKSLIDIDYQSHVNVPRHTSKVTRAVLIITVDSVVRTNQLQREYQK